MEKSYVIGLDYGSLSCRGILVCLQDGCTAAEAEYAFPHGAISRHAPDGTALPEGWVLQDPSDFEEALFTTVRALMEKSRAEPSAVLAIGIDTTASTVIPVDSELRPLCYQPRWKSNRYAWPMMWKHHASAPYAVAMTKALSERGSSLLSRYGGAIGAEFFLPKVVQIAVEEPEVYKAADTFLELGDYLVSLLVGHETRSGTMLECKAGWTRDTGYLSSAFFESIGVPDVPGEKLMGRGGKEESDFWPGEKAGTLCEEMAVKLGLNSGTAVTAAQMDGYAGLPGSGISEEGRLMMMVGTSTAYMLLQHQGRPIPGICGATEDSILPGYTSYACGQASVGDAFEWAVNNVFTASCRQKALEQGVNPHEYLSGLAGKMKPGECGLLALDWLNGNKSILNDADLSGMILGLTLRTRPEHIYRSLMEATGFGARKIIENLEKQGVHVGAISVTGGIARKNQVLMQMYADILGREIGVMEAEQTAALGAAVYAAAAAGAFQTVENAVEKLADHPVRTYYPDPENHRLYDVLYEQYSRLHDLFGSGENSMMATLRALAKENRGESHE